MASRLVPIFALLAISFYPPTLFSPPTTSIVTLHFDHSSVCLTSNIVTYRYHLTIHVDLVSFENLLYAASNPDVYNISRSHTPGDPKVNLVPLSSTSPFTLGTPVAMNVYIWNTFYRFSLIAPLGSTNSARSVSVRQTGGSSTFVRWYHSSRLVMYSSGLLSANVPSQALIPLSVACDDGLNRVSQSSHSQAAKQTAPQFISHLLQSGGH